MEKLAQKNERNENSTVKGLGSLRLSDDGGKKTKKNVKLKEDVSKAIKSQIPVKESNFNVYTDKVNPREQIFNEEDVIHHQRMAAARRPLSQITNIVNEPQNDDEQVFSQQQQRDTTDQQQHRDTTETNITALQKAESDECQKAINLEDRLLRSSRIPKKVGGRKLVKIREESVSRVASEDEDGSQSKAKVRIPFSENNEIDSWQYQTRFQLKSHVNYMDLLRKVDIRMRCTLCDWLAHVTDEFRLTLDTFFIATDILNRVIVKLHPKENLLQLVATTSLLVAADVEEIYPPELKEFATVTDHAYSVAQVMCMEEIIITILNFDVNIPTLYWFCTYYCMGLNSVNEEFRITIDYLSQLCVLFASHVRFLADDLAAAILYYAQKYFKCTDVLEVERITGKNERKLIDENRYLKWVVQIGNKYPSLYVYKKYSEREKKFVAIHLNLLSEDVQFRLDFGS